MLRKLQVFTLGSALALAVPLGAREHRSNRPPDPTDAQILQDVQKAIADHPSFKDIRASVDDRIVTLEGSVQDYHNKVRAADILRHAADKVEGVRNLLAVNTQTVPDEQLKSKLADKLRYDRIDRGIMFNNLTLDVKNGNVMLGGEVRTDMDRASAVSIVENTPGVKDVVENIKVAPVSFHDDDLRIKIARAIYGHPALQKYALDPQAPIRIVVDQGHVTLFGVVDSQMDKQIAEVQAKTVPGAFSVDDKLVVSSREQASTKH